MNHNVGVCADALEQYLTAAQAAISIDAIGIWVLTGERKAITIRSWDSEMRWLPACKNLWRMT